jgi:hypothetical protein
MASVWFLTATSSATLKPCIGPWRKVITATPRQLESLIRLSESLARMRQGLTLVHCSAQPEPFLTQNTP